MTKDTEIPAFTLISKGYWHECLWAQDLSTNIHILSHSHFMNFFISFVGKKEQFAK